MAHSLSSRKRIRQNVTRNLRNRSRKAEIKTQLKDCVDKLVHAGAADAEKAVATAVRSLDRAGNQRAIHRNAAARRKSRLMRKLNALKKAKPAK